MLLRPLAVRNIAITTNVQNRFTQIKTNLENTHGLDDKGLPRYHLKGSPHFNHQLNKKSTTKIYCCVAATRVNPFSSVFLKHFLFKQCPHNVTFWLLEHVFCRAYLAPVILMTYTDCRPCSSIAYAQLNITLCHISCRL